MILVFAVFCLAGAAFLVGEIATAPARQRWSSVRRAATYGRMEVRSEAQGESFHDRLLAPLREWLAGWALRANPRLSVDSIGMKLLAAGVGRRISPTGFLALKGGAALGGLVLGTMLGRIGGIGVALLGALVLGALGFFIPDYALTLKARGRRERIQADLPDALDLLAVSVEAGLGFDGAVAKLSEHMEGPLAEEFGLTLSEMRIGESAWPIASMPRSSPPSCERSSRPTRWARPWVESSACRLPIRASAARRLPRNEP